MGSKLDMNVIIIGGSDGINTGGSGGIITGGCDGSKLVAVVGS